VRTQYERRDLQERCRHWNRYNRREDRWWASANATAVWKARPGRAPHCTVAHTKYETKHWKRLRAWRAAITAR
jgi:hypothetical protein